MARRRRQIAALKISVGAIIVIFLCGAAFELGRYVARRDTDNGLIGGGEDEPQEIQLENEEDGEE